MKRNQSKTLKTFKVTLMADNKDYPKVPAIPDFVITVHAVNHREAYDAAVAASTASGGIGHGQIWNFRNEEVR